MSVKIVPYNSSLEDASDALNGKKDSTFLFFKIPDVATAFNVVHLGVVGEGRNHFMPIAAHVSNLCLK